MKELRSLVPYFKRYQALLWIGCFCIAFQNVMGLYVPVIVRKSVDAIQQAVHNSAQHLNASGVLYWVAIIIGLALLKGIGMYYMRQTIIVMSRKIEFDQRNDMFKRYQELDNNFYKTHATGDLMARINEDVSRVRMFTGPAILYSINLFLLILLVIGMMLYVNVELALLTLLPLPFLSYSVYYVNTIINKRSEAVQQQLSALTTNSQEVYAGIRVIKSYVQENAIVNYFAKQADEYRDRSLKLAFVESVYFPLLAFLIGISNIIIIYVCGHLIMKNLVTPGNMAEYFLYLNMLVWPVTSLGWVVSIIQRAAVSQRRINEFMQMPVADERNLNVAELNGSIEFDNVNLIYDNTGIQALKHVSFKIKAGEKVAIIGKTGSGKSSIAQLLMKVIPSNSGTIRINNQEIDTLSAASIRAQSAVVPQDLFLFSDTVANNISLGLESTTEAELIAVAKLAQVHDEIMRLPNLYETEIGERGVTLSGGQKQRICIARALIKQPRLIVLDDCLSAVDTTTEKAILTNLQTVFEGRTVINITHRVMHLLHFDRILVLEEGKLIEQGAPQELLAKNGYFAKIYREQQLQAVAEAV